MGFPTTFVIDREGIIRTKFVGSTPDKFERLQQSPWTRPSSPPPR